MDKKNATEYKNKFNAENYDRYSLMLPRGTKEKIKAAADAAGLSVNAYINQAIAERMQSDKNNI